MRDYHFYEDESGDQLWYLIGAPAEKTGYIWTLPSNSAMGIFADSDYTDAQSYGGGAYYAIRIAKS